MVNLIIGGGSFKGISYLGALEYLYKNNLLDNLENSYSTSVGSLICVFFCTGWKPYDIFKTLSSLNFKDFWDFNLTNIDKTYSVISDLLFIKVKEIYSSKEKSDITFKEFYDKYNINLNIYATSLKSRTNICFNKNTFPDLNVFTAVQASCSIPILFPPVIIDGEYFIDGCMKCVDGICYDILHNIENSEQKNYIIKGNYKQKNIDSFMSYLSEIINCTLHNYTELDTEYTINIKTEDKYNNQYNFGELDYSDKLIDHLHACEFNNVRTNITLF